MIKLSLKKQAQYLFLFAFCFATIVALLFTKFLLPTIPSLHGGFGLLRNDALYFHESALILSHSISNYGWTAWSMWSTELNTSGNVGVLSALYALFSSEDPALIIPINAFFHACSALFLLLIGREIWPGRAGNLAGFITAVLFVIFPSALIWYSQPLKDSYVIAGVLIVLYSLLKLLKPLSIKQGTINLIMMVVGMCLIIFVKPYYVKLLLLIVSFICFLIVYWKIYKYRSLRTHVLFSLLAVGLTFAVYQLTPATIHDGTIYEKTSSVVNFDTYQHTINDDLAKKISSWKWRDSFYPHNFVEQYFKTAAQTRLGMVSWNLQVGASTLVDEERLPDSILSTVAYLPRALQVGLFAPFPNMWFEKVSIPKLGLVAETFIWYLIAPGILITLYYRRSIQLAIALIYALFFIAVFSFVGPNVGSLHRARYGFEFLMMLIGVGGWIVFISQHYIQGVAGFKSSSQHLDAELVVPLANTLSEGKKGLVRCMAIISAVTLIGSLGFFLRDFLMTLWFGLGSQMDSFILGAMFPMLLVAIFSIPAGVAFIPTYTGQFSKDPESAKSLLAFTAIALSILLAVLAITLHFALPHLVSLLNWKYSYKELLDIQYISSIYLFVLWLSGLVVLANSALTAVGKVIFPNFVQLIVPLTTLTTLAIFGTSFGVFPVAYAMLAGQFLNLLIVVYSLHYFHLLPTSLPNWQAVRGYFPVRDYIFLMVTALSVAAIIPVTNLIAANLEVGSVSIIGISTKVIILITGIIGMGINTVLLPYFSKLIAKLQLLEAKSDFSFLLLWITLLSVPTTLLLTFMVEPMLILLLSSGKLAAQELNTLTKVIQYGIIQLPFYACALVSSKYIAAHKRTGMILISALVCLVITIVVGSALSKIIGVAGITLGMTVASAVSAAMLVFYTNYLRHLSVTDSLFIGFNWILFVSLFLFLHFEVYVGLIITAIIYSIFIIGEWEVLTSE